MHTARDLPARVHTSAVRPGAIALTLQGFRDAWSRRRLIRYLVQADMKKKGADTVLGNVWWVLDPLLQMAVYVVLVSVILQVKVPDYPLFIFAAILPWKWFQSSVQDAITSVVSQERLIKQIQFPKIVLPVAATMAGIVNFAFGLIPLLGLLVFLYSDRLSPLVLLVPVIAVVQLVFTLGVALVVAAINVFYRDVGNVSRHALRLLFYLSPALYSVDAIEKIADQYPLLGTLMALNPFAVLFEAYRSVIYGTADSGPIPPDWTSLAILLVVSIFLLLGATHFFKRVEPAFAKVL